MRQMNLARHVIISLPLARLLMGGLLAMVLNSCATSTGVQAGKAAPVELDVLYTGIDVAVARYRDGLKRLQEGEPEQGQQLMDDAADELAAGGNVCVTTRGCEPQRFMSAYNNLLALRSVELLGGAGGFVEMESMDEESPVTEDIPEIERAASLFGSAKLAESIKINGPIKAAMQDWLTWMRPNLIEAHEQYQYMRHLMWPAYEKQGYPEALLFGMLAKESGGKVHAVSSAGAAGPFQFMYQTGLRFGLQHDQGFDMRYDPAASARANAAYLNEQLRHLNNNLEFTLAAYNAGEGRMRNLAKRSRSKSFWSPEVMNRLPRETQEYVPYVLAAAWLFMHPQDYGLQFPNLDAAPGSVRLNRAMTLSELNVCLGQAAGSHNGWFRTLRNLNPRVDPDRQLAAGTSVALPSVLAAAYEKQCVSGPMAQLAAELRRARQPGSVAYGGGRKYIVKPGDTLGAIARRQRCANTEALARANNIRGPSYVIRARQELTLVGCSS